MRYSQAVVGGLAALVAAQKPQFREPFPPTPALPASDDYAPSVLPTVQDKTAPNAQKKCPGYKASNIKQSSTGLTADLTLAGSPCSVYGNDIHNLQLSVEYQSKERLAVRIVPTYISAKNQTQYILDADYTPYPGIDQGSSKQGSDLKFTYSNSPSFQFKVERSSSGEVLFDTTGHVIVFEDQFLELQTNMVSDYNIYGLGESLHPFRLGNDYTQTFWSSYNLENDNLIDVNTHSTQPMYLETRYSGNGSTSHGVYARNAHGQDWLLQSDSITYRTIGGSFDFYFLSGETPKEVISQYHTQIIGTPYFQPYWTLGFMQVRWGYQNWTALQDVLDAYAAQDIQIEMIANDLDYMHLNRDFTNDAKYYGTAQGQKFLDRLHAAGQYWFPILDPNIYAPSLKDPKGTYPTYDRGLELDVFIKNGDDVYYGCLWPGISAYVDFIAPNAQQFWTEQFKTLHDRLPFDGFWLDVSDASSFCTYSYPPGEVSKNPIHLPIELPGQANTSQAVNYMYPEMFHVTNATEASSAAAARASQSKAYPSPATKTPTHAPTKPTPGVRQENFPPYAIKNDAVPGNSLVKQVLAPNATHNDAHNTSEYDIHNLYGHLSIKATVKALEAAKPGLRPFALSRSTFAGTGAYAGHWGGDTNAKWGDMYFGIIQALQNSIAGIAYFGVEGCGFNGNSDRELCTRWMQLASWFPLYRNHNNRNTIAQEAYRWATTAEATRRVSNIRYSLLPYTYTLFYNANKVGDTVLRALQWEFPDEEDLKAIETQFMSGPSLLITPVLAPLATSVKGVFPGVSTGTLWYDWYTLAKVNAKPGVNMTMNAPLVHQPIHVRGGSILPIQKAGNTTAMSRKSDWSLLIALDKDASATGSLYLDDGVSIKQAATKEISFSYSKNTFKSRVTGSFNDKLPLANVTVAGISSCPKSISVNGKKAKGAKLSCMNGVLSVTNLEKATSGGVWSKALTFQLNGSSGKSSNETVSDAFGWKKGYWANEGKPLDDTFDEWA